MTDSFSLKIGDIYSTVKLCGEVNYTAETVLPQAVQDAFTAYMLEKEIIDEASNGFIEIEYTVVGYDEVNRLIINARVGIYTDGNLKRGAIFIMSRRTIGTDVSDVWSDTDLFATVPPDMDMLMVYTDWAREMNISYVDDLNSRIFGALKSFSDWDEIVLS